MQPNKLTIFLLYNLLILLLITSCSNSLKNNLAHKKFQSHLLTSNGITGGSEYPDQDSPPGSIAAIYSSDQDSPVGSAVFLSNQYLLTAYHIFEHSDLSNFKIAYTGRTATGDQYPEAAIESLTRYKNLDLAIIKLKALYPSPPMSRVFIYHGYYFNKYKVQQGDEIVAFGYGYIYDNGAGDIQLNENSILKTINGEIYDFISATSQLAIETSDGSTTSADSGGPIEYQNKLVAVVAKSIIQLNRTDAILLTPDILKWIAISIKEPIFNNPIEYGELSESNNTILFTGWGSFNNNIVQIYDSNNSLIASCSSFSVTAADSWTCAAKLADNYNPRDIEYTAYFYNQTTGLFGDSVDFEINPYGRDLVIDHPKPPETDDDIYTYQVPIGHTYTVRGTGTAGDHIRYKLIRLDIDDHTPNEHPCINSSDSAIIQDSGRWQCQIKMDLTQEQYYQFEASVADKGYETINLVTTKYIVEPDTLSTIKIIQPKPNEEVNPSHITKILIGQNSGSKNMVYSLQIGDNDSLVFRDELPMAESVLEYSVRSLHPNGLNKAHLVASIYSNDDDEIPLETDSIDYLVKGLSVKFTSPDHDDQTFDTVDKILMAGKVNLSEVNEKPEDYFIQIDRRENGQSDYSFYCMAAIKSDEEWQCEGTKAFEAEKKYSLKAILVDKDEGKAIVTAIISINIVAAKVEITQPNPN